MLDTTKPMYNLNGWLTVHNELGPCAISESSHPDMWAEAKAYLAEHPEALVPEPAPPEPTPAELAARARARTLADLAALDARAIRPLRAIAAGTATDGDRKELERIETEVVELRKRLA